MGQIVCADREEINETGKLRTHNCRCWRFDHNTEFIASAWLCLLEKLLPKFRKKSLYLKDLFYFRDHRDHDCKISVVAGAQQRPQLCAENIPAVQADPKRTIAKRRIVLLWQRKIRYFFIRANVHGANDDTFRRKPLQRIFVCFKLCLFIRIILMGQIEKLTTEKADAVGTAYCVVCNIIQNANICTNFDSDAISADCRVECTAAQLSLM